MQQTINPFEQILDEEAYELLTKCDRKLGVAVLSLALKKFSENKEFLYFLKPENRDKFDGLVDEEVKGVNDDISMNPTVPGTQTVPDNQSNSSASNASSASSTPSPSSIAVAW